MRIAFLTPEFPTTHDSSGGLATFLGRAVLAIASRGHQVTVFTVANKNSVGTVIWNGVSVEHVSAHPVQPNWYQRLARVWGRLDVSELQQVLLNAFSLSKAFANADSINPFDVVHGADFGLTTLYLTPRSKLKVIVRVSSASGEIRKLLGLSLTLQCQLFSFYERKQLMAADQVYAPSRYAAKYYERRLGAPIRLLRPPMDVSNDDLLSTLVPFELPTRFLLHFGTIGLVKGSDVLAKALQLAWKKEPELTMVWAGTDKENRLPIFRKSWNDKSNRVMWIGSLDRVSMRCVLRRAAAVIAPSRVDNLPNNVLEAQSLRIPTVGTLNSSIDEIVMNGITGELVPIGDTQSLANALVNAWRGKEPFDGSRWKTPEIFRETEVHTSISKLIELCSE